MSWSEKKSNEIAVLKAGAALCFHMLNATAVTVVGFLIALFIDYLKLGISGQLELTFGIVLALGGMVAGVLLYRHCAGRVWFDCGRPLLNPFYLMISIGLMIVVWVGVNLEAPPPKNRLYDANVFRPSIDFVQARFICSFAFYSLFLSFTRDQIRERGFWLQFRLLTWETITSYKWRETRDGTTELSLRTNVMLPFLCCGTLRIPAQWKDEINERLQKHISASADR